MNSDKDKIDGLSNKFTQDEWNVIERKYSSFDLKVLDCLKLLGKSFESCEIKPEYNVLGETLYIANRDLLLNPFELVFPITKAETKETKEKKKQVKKLSKTKEEIILENSKRRSKEEIETVLKTFKSKIQSKEELQPKYAFNSDFVEIKGIGLMYAGHYLYTNNLQFRKTKDLLFIFTVMVSIERFISSCQGLEGKNMLGVKESVSKTMLNDLLGWFEKLETIYTYNGFAVHDYAPELLIFTEFDKAIPAAGIKPRKHQIELIKKISEHFDSGFLLAYFPPMSSGKTVSIIAIASYLTNHINVTANDQKRTQLICACNLPPVRDHMAGLCYNAGVKFAIASINPTSGKYTIVNHYSCAKDSDRLVIITSPEVAYEILKDDQDGTNCENYMLFVDEPTVGADNIRSETLKTNMLVLSVAPKRTILSSATFPDLDLIPNITEYFRQKYSTIVMDTVYSNEIQISCDVKKFNFDIVTLHSNIKTQKQLLETIDTISKNPFLGRMYTSDVVRSLWMAMKKYNVKEILDIEKIFQHVDNMDSDKVRRIAMELLNMLSYESDETIENVCSCNIAVEHTILENIDSSSSKIKSNSSLWENDEDDSELDFDKLATSQAWLMQNTTLIATLDPIKFVQDHFYKFIKEDIYNHYVDPIVVDQKKQNIFDQMKRDIIATDDAKNDKKNVFFECGSSKNNVFKNALSSFEKERNNLERKIETYEKSLDNSPKTKCSPNSEGSEGRRKDGERFTKVDIDKKIQELEDSVPKLDFPDYGHINSKEHAKKYAGSGKIFGRNIRIPPALESIQYHNFNVSDEILALLFTGVGVYSTNDKSICPNYLKAVLDMASSGKLAYIVADVSICYGTNYPINRIIVTDDFANAHSINTLFQLFGRAGRVGRSWIAIVYVSEMVSKKLVDYVQKNIKIDTEAENMCSIFDECISKTNLSENAFLNYIIEKYITGGTNKKVQNKKEIEIIRNSITNASAGFFSKETEASISVCTPNCDVKVNVKENIIIQQPPQMQQNNNRRHMTYCDFSVTAEERVKAKENSIIYPSQTHGDNHTQMQQINDNRRHVQQTNNYQQMNDNHRHVQQMNNNYNYPQNQFHDTVVQQPPQHTVIQQPPQPRQFHVRNVEQPNETKTQGDNKNAWKRKF